MWGLLAQVRSETGTLSKVAALAKAGERWGGDQRGAIQLRPVRILVLSAQS